MGRHCAHHFGRRCIGSQKHKIHRRTGDAVSVNHDFSSIAVGGIQSATITVAGANSNKVLVVNADLPDGVLLQIKSTSPDAARLTIFNFTGAIYDPGLTTFLIRILD